MRNDPVMRDQYQFAMVDIMQVNYLELNNRNPILADVKVRLALAYTIDYNGLLNNVMHGVAERTVGPIHPDKIYYNDDLKPIQQDINKAIELLKEAGWSDTNGNGIPDKMISGKKQELQLAIKITNKEEGTAIANIVKENAKKAGFDLRLEVVEPSQFSQDVRQNNFEIIPLRIRLFPGFDDPYPSWHSSNDRPGGSNRSGFRSAELDQVIQNLRTTKDPEERNKYYKKFQEIIYEMQPVIFLYAPLERIMASKRIELVTSSRRPGYFENLLQPSGTE
jgi:peptide/nickel transport system substrate-binding protein